MFLIALRDGPRSRPVRFDLVSTVAPWLEYYIQTELWVLEPIMHVYGHGEDHGGDVFSRARPFEEASGTRFNLMMREPTEAAPV